MDARKAAPIAAILFLALAGVAVAAEDAPQVRYKDGVGNYLTDGAGSTLYYITRDKSGRSACSGPYLLKWPVYYREKIRVPAGSDSKDFGEFTRPDGEKQTTFKGWPLYYFSGDKVPGDTNGQGAQDMWFVINPITIPSCY